MLLCTWRPVPACHLCHGFLWDIAGVTCSSWGLIAGWRQMPHSPLGWVYPLSPVTTVRHRGISPHVEVGSPRVSGGQGALGQVRQGWCPQPVPVPYASPIPSGPDPALVLEGKIL